MAISAVLLFGGCTALVVAVAGSDQPTTKVRTAPTTTAAPVGDEDLTETTPETTAPEGPPVAGVGDTLTMSDGFGVEVAEITVGGLTSPSKHEGLRFSTGDEYNTPEHGLWMGVWVKLKALQDGVDTPSGNLHVSQQGRHYDGDACCPDGFKPQLDYATLSEGETTEGWVIFDVASRHGAIVITNNSFDKERIGAWKF